MTTKTLVYQQQTLEPLFQAKLELEIAAIIEQFKREQPYASSFDISAKRGQIRQLFYNLWEHPELFSAVIKKEYDKKGLLIPRYIISE